MKCSKCGYDWSNSGDSAHVCGSVKVKQQEQRNVSEQLGEPVLIVEKEPDYMSNGHFHSGRKPYIDPTKVWRMPIGTKLYTTPQPKQEPVAEPHKGEPVAWMQDSIELYVQEEKDEKRGYVIPLYAHPQDQKKDEALRLALEALKFSTAPAPSVAELQNDAITLIEQALENK